MRSLSWHFTIFTSCEQTENCDLNYYPSAPYGNQTIHYLEIIKLDIYTYAGMIAVITESTLM